MTESATCTCPDLDASSPWDLHATVKGLDPGCHVHGVPGGPLNSHDRHLLATYNAERYRQGRLPRGVAAVSTQDQACRSYWGASGCDLQRGHGPHPLPEHRQSEHVVTARTAYLFGEDLTEVERAIIEQEW